jgi:glycerol-3-phosphate cytidylyltransferase
MNYKKGVIAGNFDVIHPGYVKMFKEMERHCDVLIVLLHTDPSIERPDKIKPILSVKDRKETLECFRMVKGILKYTYEEQLYDLLKMGEFDIRFLGDDYKNKPFTGDNLPIPIHYLDRSHGWSTTKFKNLIHGSIFEHNLQ